MVAVDQRLFDASRALALFVGGDLGFKVVGQLGKSAIPNRAPHDRNMGCYGDFPECGSDLWVEVPAPVDLPLNPRSNVHCVACEVAGAHCPGLALLHHLLLLRDAPKPLQDGKIDGRDINGAADDEAEVRVDACQMTKRLLR